MRLMFGYREAREEQNTGKSCLKTSHFVILLAALILVSPSARAQTKNAPERPSFPKLRLARHFQGEEAIAALGANLPAVAAFYHKTPEELQNLLRREKDLHLDNDGRLYYVCNWQDTQANAGTTPPPETESPQPALVPLDQTFQLHSRPGATRTIYLCFVGFTLSGTAWNASNLGGTNLVAPPWDTDGDPTTFSSTERTAIQQIWLRVAEDYSPYDVDVTTEDTGEATLTRSSSSDQVFGQRALVSAIGKYFGNPGGISYVGVFDYVGDYYKPSLIFPENLANSEKYIAEAISHEVGHSLGLSHDGTTNASYYSGQGNWAPIMGVGYYHPISQWSKGEYAAANNTQDDLTIITQNGVNYRVDDFGNTIGTAMPLAGATPATNGVIERSTDVDFFSFQSGSGTATLTVSPAERGANLHLFVAVYDGSGNLLTNREVADTTAGVLPVVISRTLSQGTYYISVEGRGSGDPVTTGYSDYASLGQYSVSLNLPPLAGTTILAPQLAIGKPNGGSLPLHFASQSGHTYVVQAATDAGNPLWQNLSTNAGTGAQLNVSVPYNSATPRRFLRILVY